MTDRVAQPTERMTAEQYVASRKLYRCPSCHLWHLDKADYDRKRIYNDLEMMEAYAEHCTAAMTKELEGQKALVSRYMKWHEQSEKRARIAEAQSSAALVRELAKALQRMFAWANYGEESDPWYFSPEQAPRWASEKTTADALLSRDDVKKALADPTKETL